MLGTSDVVFCRMIRSIPTQNKKEYANDLLDRGQIDSASSSESASSILERSWKTGLFTPAGAETSRTFAPILPIMHPHKTKLSLERPSGKCSPSAIAPASPIWQSPRQRCSSDKPRGRPFASAHVITQVVAFDESILREYVLEFNGIA